MNSAVKYLAVGLLGLGVGVGAGYFIEHKRLEKSNQDYLDLMEENYRDLRARVTKTGPYETIEGAAEAVLSMGNEPDLGVLEPEHELTDEEVLRQSHDGAAPIPNSQEIAEENGFDPKEFVEQFKNRLAEETYGGVTFPGQAAEGEGPEKNEDAQFQGDEDTVASSVPGFITVRSETQPYVITIDEFMENNSDEYSRDELTWFDGDGKLVDRMSRLIPDEDVDALVGLANMDRFGEGTTDSSQVYICNEHLKIYIEVTKDEDTYARQILHMIPADEIQRSMQKPLKMRESDGD